MQDLLAQGPDVGPKSIRSWHNSRELGPNVDPRILDPEAGPISLRS